MKIELAGHFSYKRIITTVLPCIIMMVFTSIYVIVDGLFISNYTGTTAFSAVNFIFPVIMIVSAVGFMIGAGGNALVSKTLGEGNKQLANQYFSMLIYVTFIGGVIISGILFIFLKEIAKALGAEGEMLKYCVVYGRILLAACPICMVQNAFQSFFMTAEKPLLGTIYTIVAGLVNIVFDALLVAVFKFGIIGAAVATSLSQFIGGVGPLIYFLSKKNNSTLKLIKARFDLKALLKTFANGSSELVTNISASIVNILYNMQLIKYIGENGVASYGVIMYVTFVFAAVFFGYNIGISPIIGYHYGAKNTKELKNLFKKSLVLIGISSICLTAISVLLSKPLSTIFVSYDKELLDLTSRALKIYMISFLICGFNIFSSAFFTALNNGLISAILSFGRTLVFQFLSILILPYYFEVDGIWFAIIVAEACSLVLTIIMFIANRKKYKY